MHTLSNRIDTQTTHPALASMSIDKIIATSMADVDHELSPYIEPIDRPDNLTQQSSGFVLNEGV